MRQLAPARVQVNLKLDPETRRQIKSLAAAQGRTEASVVTIAIDRMYQASNRQKEDNMTAEIKTVEVTLDRGDIADFLADAECGAEEAIRRYCRQYERLIAEVYSGAQVDVTTENSIGHNRIVINDANRGYGETGDFEVVDSIAEKLVNDWSWLDIES